MASVQGLRQAFCLDCLRVQGGTVLADVPRGERALGISLPMGQNDSVASTCLVLGLIFLQCHSMERFICRGLKDVAWSPKRWPIAAPSSALLPVTKKSYF